MQHRTDDYAAKRRTQRSDLWDIKMSHFLSIQKFAVDPRIGPCYIYANSRILPTYYCHCHQTCCKEPCSKAGLGILGVFTPSPEFSTFKAFLSKIAQNSQHVGSTSCFRGFLKCKFCEEQQYIAGRVVCLPHACLKGEISEKEKQAEIKSAITWDPGPRRTSEQNKMKHFCYFNALLIRLSVCSVHVRGVHMNCVRKRSRNRQVAL